MFKTKMRKCRDDEIAKLFRNSTYFFPLVFLLTILLGGVVTRILDLNSTLLRSHKAAFITYTPGKCEVGDRGFLEGF